MMKMDIVIRDVKFRENSHSNHDNDDDDDDDGADSMQQECLEEMPWAELADRPPVTPVAMLFGQILDH